MTMGEYRKLIIKSWSFPTLGGIEPADWNEKDEILSSFLRAHILNPTAMFCLHRHDTLDAEEIKAMMKERLQHESPGWVVRSRTASAIARHPANAKWILCTRMLWRSAARASPRWLP